MLFSCKVQASSVKFVDPVHTAAVWYRLAPSGTMYFECINCPDPAVIARVATLVPVKCCCTHCAVPNGVRGNRAKSASLPATIDA